MSAVSWWGYGIAVTVLVLLLAGLVVLVRIISGDSEKYEELKAMLDPLFHAPAFLRPGEEARGDSKKRDETAAVASQEKIEPFEEKCPGCGETVTHVNAECPSCGLRLMDG
ncbi:hypothetical protein [Cohnella caldifontis]|uniref:hypothetical protein n=1 Tax=Cohnella caldifontis TaxID=3027471 RepID=UPI0023EC4487|nr:hypothetical protein [Cohnella sp. YIM B05605]